jgi:ABC-type sugar transport system substrate-binding protein
MRILKFMLGGLLSLCLVMALALWDNTSEAEDKFKVIYIAPSLGNAADVVIAKNWQEVANSQGMDAVIKSAENDPKREADEWDTAIALGYDAIVGGPVDSNAATASVKKANAAGIPVFMLGRTSAGGTVELIARADQAALGTLAAEELVRRLKEQRGEVKGIILELQGEMASSNAKVRSDAINAVLSQYSGLEVISRNTHWLAEQFYDLTKSIASVNDVVGITMGSDVIPGVDAALKSIGKLKKIGEPGHIVVTGIDGDPRVLGLMGEDYWDASALQDMVGYGTILAHYMKDYLDGSFKIDMAGKLSNPGRAYDDQMAMEAAATEGWEIQTPSRVIDKSNYTDPALWGNAIKRYQ